MLEQNRAERVPGQWIPGAPLRDADNQRGRRRVPAGLGVRGTVVPAELRAQRDILGGDLVRTRRFDRRPGGGGRAPTASTVPQ